VRHTPSNPERDALASQGLKACVWTLAAATSSFAMLVSCEDVHAQDLASSIRQPWSLYVFVSSQTPQASLVGLAREATQAGAVLVLRGFPANDATLAGAQAFTAHIDAACCGVEPKRADATAGAGIVPAWVVDPKLYQTFGVRAVPAFVLARTGSTREQDFCEVEGDMALANALKFFAQKSASPAIRQQAAQVYAHAFGGRS
jgi:conjugal transfer pilus assembly protein TrbC